jgi:hypothetical protein
MERDTVVGGQATTLSVDGGKYGTDWVNTGPKFAQPDFSHTLHFLREYGYEPPATKAQLAFGKGQDNFWTTIFPTTLLQRHEKDIKRFRKLLGFTNLSRKLVWSMPLKTFLRIFRFNKEFADKIIYPLASTLVPMGNYGDKLPVGMAQWLFTEDKRNIWDPSVRTAMPNLPTMYAFPNMGRFFKDWAAGLREKGVQIRLGTQALKVVQRNKHGVAVETRSAEADYRLEDEGVRDRTITETFHKLVLCIHGDEAKRILGDRATRLEKRVLGWAQFYDDISVTHTDSGYIQGKYEALFREELCAEQTTEVAKERLKFARGEMGPGSGYRPSFCTYSYPQRPDKIELTIDCSNVLASSPFDAGDQTEIIPFDKHIFQSHFMDQDVKHLWTIDQIQPDRILERKWIRIPFQTWQHWLRVVPLMKCINGTKGTLYAGGWTHVVSRLKDKKTKAFASWVDPTDGC